MKYLSNECGDTLVEVSIALAILAAVLLGSYSVATRSFRFGQTAKERQQMTAVMQQQAEYLRYARDHSSSWGAFLVNYQNCGGPGCTFYIPGSTNASGDFTPAKRIGVMPGQFQVSISRPVCDQPHPLTLQPDRCLFMIHGEWDTPGGGGGRDHADFPYTLVNNSFLKAQ